jgi:hypothetical protein
LLAKFDRHSQNLFLAEGAVGMSLMIPVG